MTEVTCAFDHQAARPLGAATRRAGGQRWTVKAAAPSNDTFANAKLVTLGFSETLETTEATTDAMV